MVYLMFINQIRPGKVKEYKEVNAQGVGLWQKYGARIVGVWENWIGGEGFELIQLFEFENFSEYEEKDARVHKDPEWAGYVTRLGAVSMGRTTRLLRPTEYSPMG
jgi:hypothetical protein